MKLKNKPVKNMKIMAENRKEDKEEMIQMEKIKEKIDGIENKIGIESIDKRSKRLKEMR